MSLFPSNSTTIAPQPTAPSAPLPIKAFDMPVAIDSDSEDQPEPGLNSAVDVDTDSISWSETLYAPSQNSGPAYQAFAESIRMHMEHKREFREVLRGLEYDDASLPVPDDAEDDASDLEQDFLHSWFIDDALESPLDSRRLSVASLGTPARPLDLDDEETLMLDFSQARVHASPNYQASPTGTQPPEAQDGAQAHAGAAIPLDLNITLELDSDAVQVALLMGCTQEHNAAPQGGYHQ